MEPWSIGLAIFGLVLTASGIWLNLRARHKPHPINIETTHYYGFKDGNTKIRVRQVEFKQEIERPDWEIQAVRTSYLCRDWLYDKDLSRHTASGWNPHKDVKWVRKIKYRIPISGGTFLLHPDAPNEMLLVFRVVLKTDHWVSRKIKVRFRTDSE